MSSRKSLGAMLGTVEQAGTPAAAPTRAPETPEQPAPLARPAIVTAPPVAAPTRAAKWLTFERKETRQRADQIEWVEAKRKQLNAARSGEGERLTDNTLIRVALDLLMERGDDLAGTTEDELRASLGIVLDRD